jgi:hypothetical protein
VFFHAFFAKQFSKQVDVDRKANVAQSILCQKTVSIEYQYRGFEDGECLRKRAFMQGSGHFQGGLIKIFFNSFVKKMRPCSFG